MGLGLFRSPPPSCNSWRLAVVVGCSIGLHLLLLVLIIRHDVAGASGGLEMSASEKRHLREEAREMFYHAYNAYMNHAYPADELMPLSCRGRYRETEPSRGDIDDALGNFSLTLVDAMDTLVVLGDLEGFESAVKLVLRDVTFDHDIVVSVFETNIRMLGGLLSGHILAGYLRDKLGRMTWYSAELLDMAKDLGYRLLPAFNTSTGVPHPRINLRYGLKSPKMANSRETCTACAGTMILEFAALSRLTGEPIFEEKTHRAMDYLWHLRHRASGLMGMVLNIHNGDWVRRDSGVGAGIDSYYEYLLKAYILLGDDTYLDRFNKHYSAIMKYVSQGPLLVDVHMHRPHTNTKNFMDALLAFWPGLQVLKGDIKPAIETHEMLYQVMQRHNFLPEAFTTDFKVHWGQHPLRPEFLESTYFLYKATDDPYYLEVGRSVLTSLKRYGRVPCGFAAVKDVRTGTHEDRMDSFVLAETFKYLFLLFADDDDLVIDINDFLFTTEAHLLPLTLARLSNTTSSIGGAGRSVGGSSPILLTRTSLNDGGSSSEAEDFEEAEEADYDHTCPNTEYLFPGKKDFAHSIRLPLKNLVDGVCPRQRSLSHRQLHATEFQAGNEEHLRLLRKMGISIAALSDGRVQLQHSAQAAQSPEDAEEGLLFMQEMIELSRSQEHQLSQQPKAVHFVARFANGSSRVTLLAAGPAQFGPELVAPKQVVALAGLASPLRACTKLTNAESLYKRIGVVERGDCMFVDKARQLQRAGAVAGIVIDNTPGTSSSTSPLFAMSGDGSNDVHIPMVFLFSQDASALLDAIALDHDLVVFLTESKEGDAGGSSSDQNRASESAKTSSVITDGEGGEGSLEVTSYVSVVDDDNYDFLQSESQMQFVGEDGKSLLVKRGIKLKRARTRSAGDEGPIPPPKITNSNQQQPESTEGSLVHDDDDPFHSKPSISVDSSGSDSQTANAESIVMRTSTTDGSSIDDDVTTSHLVSLKDATRLDVGSIITLWQREKEYVLSLQRLIQTAFGDNKELDADTKLLLDQLGELMRPKEPPPVSLIDSQSPEVHDSTDTQSNVEEKNTATTTTQNEIDRNSKMADDQQQSTGDGGRPEKEEL